MKERRETVVESRRGREKSGPQTDENARHRPAGTVYSKADRSVINIKHLRDGRRVV